MPAPLRKVVSRARIIESTSEFRRGSLVVKQDNWRTHFTLECGHVFVDSANAPAAETKPCRWCAS